jgi:hypothetical protein
MAHVCVQTSKRVYANDLSTLLCTEDDEVPHVELQQLPKIHQQACKSICSFAVLLHHCSVIPHVHTYINVYELWYAFMHALCDKENEQPQHRKHEATQHFKRMPSRKLTVVVPAVCFWVSVKCSESFDIRTYDLAQMIDVVFKDRGDDDLFEYPLQELRDAEDMLLHLLDFDILKQQDKIDEMERKIRAEYADEYDSTQAQSEIVRIIYSMFNPVPDTIE